MIISQTTLPNKQTGFQTVRFVEWNSGAAIAAPLSTMFVDRAIIEYVAGLMATTAWAIGSNNIIQNGYIDNRDAEMVDDGDENVNTEPIQHIYIPSDHDYTIVTNNNKMQYLNGADRPPLSSTFLDWSIIESFATALGMSRQELETDLLNQFGWIDER